MPYQIDVIDTVPGNVFTLHRVIRADQVGTDIGAGLAELHAEVDSAGLHPAGPPSVTYLDPLTPGGKADVELGVAVAPGAGRGDGDGAVVEALDPVVLVRAAGLAELEPVAAEARERLAAVLTSVRRAVQPWTG